MLPIKSQGDPSEEEAAAKHRGERLEDASLGGEEPGRAGAPGSAADGGGATLAEDAD